MSFLTIPVPPTPDRAPDNALSMSDASFSTRTSATSIEDERVLDIGGSKLKTLLKEAVERELLWKSGQFRPAGRPQRMLPWSLHSDDRGAEFWSDITHLPHYYQTRDEIELFQKHGEDIAGHVHDNSVMLDMGCGDVRKIIPFLDILESLKKPVEYYGLDLSHQALVLAMDTLLAKRYRYVKCHALWGTFRDCLDWAQELPSEKPRLFMSLGSVFGNDHFDNAVAQFHDWAVEALPVDRPQDALLLTMDACEYGPDLWRQYSDSDGLWEQFIRNGAEHSNRVLDCEWYHEEDWDLKVVVGKDPVSHRFVLQAKTDVIVPSLDLDLKVGDEIDCYESFKYTPTKMREQFQLAGVKEYGCWKAPDRDIYQYLVRGV